MSSCKLRIVHYGTLIFIHLRLFFCNPCCLYVSGSSFSLLLLLMLALSLPSLIFGLRCYESQDSSQGTLTDCSGNDDACFYRVKHDASGVPFYWRRYCTSKQATSDEMGDIFEFDEDANSFVLAYHCDTDGCNNVEPSPTCNGSASAPTCCSTEQGCVGVRTLSTLNITSATGIRAIGRITSGIILGVVLTVFLHNLN